MLRDPYANYVVQRIIEVADERHRERIVKYVQDNITQLRRYTYGKHIIAKLEKITGQRL
jgi:pumilio RNA-binding family